MACGGSLCRNAKIVINMINNLYIPQMCLIRQEQNCSIFFEQLEQDSFFFLFISFFQMQILYLQKQKG